MSVADEAKSLIGVLRPQLLGAGSPVEGRWRANSIRHLLPCWARSFTSKQADTAPGHAAPRRDERQRRRRVVGE
jgi:hypothetical protein